MHKIGVVGTKGGLSSEWLADEVLSQTGFRMLVEMDKVALDFTRKTAFFQGTDLMDLDALIVKKIGSKYSPDLLDRLEVLRFLHACGMPVFSAPLSMMRVVDRLSCTVTLQAAGVPMPPTVVTEDIDQAKRAVQEFGEAVFKPLYTSKARGMRVITHGPDTEDEIRRYAHENRIMYIQQKIDLQGRDLGLAFLGGKYVTTYARCNQGSSWNTTTRSGGKYASYTPSQASIDVGAKAQSLFDLDFTCVDIAETEDGPMVFEVSAFGGFRGIWEAQNINAARLLVGYVLERISRSPGTGTVSGNMMVDPRPEQRQKAG